MIAFSTDKRSIEAPESRGFYRTLIAGVLLVFLWLINAPGARAEVQLENIRTAVHPDKTRVVIDLSGPTDYEVVTNYEAGKLELLILDTQMSTRIRQRLFVGTPIFYASHSPREEGLRLTFDLSRDVTAKSFLLKPYEKWGDRIVIDIYDVAGPLPEEQIAENSTIAVHAHRDESGDRTYESPSVSSRKAQTPEKSYAFSGTWEQEWAFETNDTDTQKFEAIIEPRLDVELSRELSMTAIARIRADATGNLGPDESKPDNYSAINGPLANNENAELSLREFYFDSRSGDILWRLGKQQVVWGQADGIKVMDVVNPQSFREFILDDFDDSRIPLWMANVEILMGETGSLQLVWIPDTTYHELAEPGTPFEVTSSLLVPQRPAGLPVEQLSPDRPDDPFGDSDAGLRYSTFLGGWDITLNYLYHYQDTPVAYQYLRDDGATPVGVVAPEYERNHLAGTTMSNVFGPFTLRAELAYNSDTFHVSSNYLQRGISRSAEFSSVLGVDWQLEAQNTLLSAQLFQSHLLDYEQAVFRGKTENTVSLLYQRDFRHDTWKFKTLGLYSLDRGDRWINVKLSHMYRDNLELWLGGDIFGGKKEGLYGQYSDRDRVLVGLELGF